MEREGILFSIYNGDVSLENNNNNTGWECGRWTSLTLVTEAGSKGSLAAKFSP